MLPDVKLSIVYITVSFYQQFIAINNNLQLHYPAIGHGENTPYVNIRGLVDRKGAGSCCWLNLLILSIVLKLQTLETFHMKALFSAPALFILICFHDLSLWDQVLFYIFPTICLSSPTPLFLSPFLLTTNPEALNGSSRASTILLSVETLDLNLDTG